jgi:hypothetical protein
VIFELVASAISFLPQKCIKDRQKTSSEPNWKVQIKNFGSTLEQEPICGNFIKLSPCDFKNENTSVSMVLAFLFAQPSKIT